VFAFWKQAAPKKKLDKREAKEKSLEIFKVKKGNSTIPDPHAGDHMGEEDAEFQKAAKEGSRAE